MTVKSVSVRVWAYESVWGLITVSCDSV